MVLRTRDHPAGYRLPGLMRPGSPGAFAGLRYHARDVTRPLAALGIT